MRMLRKDLVLAPLAEAGLILVTALAGWEIVGHTLSGSQR